MRLGVTWTLIGLLAVGAICHIALIGHPRSPYSKESAIATIIVSTLFALAYLYIARVL